MRTNISNFIIERCEDSIELLEELHANSQNMDLKKTLKLYENLNAIKKFTEQEKK